MTRRRRRRPGVDARRYQRRQRSSLMQLAFAIGTLAVLLVAWNALADGAAGCFSRVAPAPSAAPEGGHDAVEGERHDAAPPPIRVKRLDELR